MTTKLSITPVPEGGFKEANGACWIKTPGDGFANSDIECCECHKPVSADETAFFCLDGGEAAHLDCVEVA